MESSHAGGFGFRPVFTRLSPELVPARRYGLVDRRQARAHDGRGLHARHALAVDEPHRLPLLVGEGRGFQPRGELRLRRDCLQGVPSALSLWSNGTMAASEKPSSASARLRLGNADGRKFTARQRGAHERDHVDEGLGHIKRAPHAWNQNPMARGACWFWLQTSLVQALVYVIACRSLSE